jgi:hypothetical protein
MSVITGNASGPRDCQTSRKPGGSDPVEPESLEEAGLPESLVESLILKILYFRGDLYGRDLSTAVGLKLSVIDGIIEALKLRHHVQIKRSMGMGTLGAVHGLTEAGRARAREALEANQYAGAAPVPLAQYVEMVSAQRPQEGWLTRGALTKALSGMVVTDSLISQFGPAVAAANSLLLYGKPGNGKTFLIESLNNLVGVPVFVPYAIECQGNIIQVYDPVYHARLDETDEGAVVPITRDSTYDRRWVQCRRPFIVSGGELSLDMLDLRFNATSKVYEAPFQLKANNGIYLIDDFGRQRATPAEVLNRWIVPMERRVDYLSFMTGGKMPVPFETFLVFSTNLRPDDLGDEAFLRRIQYKMLLRGPARNEFLRIFQRFCRANQIPYRSEVVQAFIAECFDKSGKPYRRCQPRDLLTHALNLIRFERLPLELTADLLRRAFSSCFVEDDEDASDSESFLVEADLLSCADYCAARAKEVPTAFGRLALLASFYDREADAYHDPNAPLTYSADELSGMLAQMHTSAFREWLNLDLEDQRDDLAGYLSTTEGRAAFLSFDHRELISLLTPAAARPEERAFVQSDFASLLPLLSSRDLRAIPPSGQSPSVIAQSA